MTAQNKWGTLWIWSLYWIKYYSIDWVIHLASHSINISCSTCFSIYLTLSWRPGLPNACGIAAQLRQQEEGCVCRESCAQRFFQKANLLGSYRTDQSSGLHRRDTHLSQSCTKPEQKCRVLAEVWLKLKTQDDWDKGRDARKKGSSLSMTHTCGSPGALVLMPSVSHFHGWKNAKPSLILLLNQEYYGRTRAILSFTP